MSGVEAAGFVLAAFPLLISALEHYRESAEVLKEWWQYKREYRKVKDEICFHRLAFEQNLEKYLLPLIADEHVLHTLIIEPLGEAWEAPELEEKLKARLPRAYELYLSTISQMNDTMEELLNVLSLDFDGVDAECVPAEKRAKNRLKSLVARENIRYEGQRAKFALGKSVRTKLFSELASYNARLRELLDTSDEIEIIRSTRRDLRGPASAKGLSKFWKHANNIFRLLQKAWGCECSPKHHVNIMLQHRTNSQVNFTLSFLFSKLLVQPQCPSWSSFRSRIDLTEDEKIESTPQFHRSFSEITINTPSTPPSKRSSMRTSLRPSRERDTSYGRSIILEDSTEALPSSTRTSVTWGSDSTPTMSNSSTLFEPAGEELDNLCGKIASFKNIDTSCLGVLKDEEHDYTLFPLLQEQRSHTEQQEMISLGSILRKEHKFKLSRRQRYHIALTLASSHLQLHKTAWLESGWSKDEILFLPDPLNSEQVSLDQPFIARDFAISGEKRGPPTADNSCSNLGIMLLELCFNSPFESQSYRKKYIPPDGQSNPYLDLAAALEWCNSEAAEEAGPDFEGAVKWCLSQFGMVDSLDEGKKAEMVEKVVRPLEYCHKQFEISSQV
ncbi:Nucleoporin [Venturia inaequalis]|nr:Nucleoporin [Venturia inaequalis]